MPVLSKNQVAFKLQRNWLAKNPSEMAAAAQDGSRPLQDDSLTNLNWLHNLNIMGEISASTPPTPPASPGPLNANCTYGLKGTPEYRNGTVSDNNDIKNRPNADLAYPTSLAGRKNNRPGTNSPQDNIDYKSNGDVKPPFSYATLICMAMKANKNKMSLSAIYKWIRENFMYYRKADAGWQNSIRHNLSLNKCFIKVPRSKDEPGKGGFWRLDPTYAEEMADGTFKKRRLSNRPAPKKMNKKDGASPPDSSSASTYFLPPPVPPQQTRSQSAQHPSLASLMTRPSTTQALLGLNGDNPGLPNLTDEETEAAVAAASLKGDFCWNSVLNEDIEMEGMRYKTADIVDMDTVSAMNSVHEYDSYKQMQQLHNANSSITCLSSPALSLDDEDLLVSDASNDLSDSLDLSVQGAIATEWWRLTSTDSLTVAGSSIAAQVGDVHSTFALGPLGNSQYDVSGAAAAFLGHGWDDVGRPVLDGSLDLDGLIDLDVY